MKAVIPIISTICQAAFFVAICLAVVEFHAYVTQWEPWEDPDPRTIMQYQGQWAENALVLLAGGLLGAALAWIALQVTGDRPKWFVGISAVFAFLWLLVFPAGILVAWFMYRWRRPPRNLPGTT